MLRSYGEVVNSVIRNVHRYFKLKSCLRVAYGSSLFFQEQPVLVEWASPQSSELVTQKSQTRMVDGVTVDDTDLLSTSSRRLPSEGQCTPSTPSGSTRLWTKLLLGVRKRLKIFRKCLKQHSGKFWGPLAFGLSRPEETPSWWWRAMILLPGATDSFAESRTSVVRQTYCLPGRNLGECPSYCFKEMVCQWIVINMHFPDAVSSLFRACHQSSDWVPGYYWLAACFPDHTSS